MGSYDARFYDIFRSLQPIQLDGLQILNFGEAAQNQAWRFGFKFACSLTHRLGDRNGILKLCCTSKGEKAEFKISIASGFETDMSYVPSEALQCLSDAYFHDGIVNSQIRKGTQFESLFCKHANPHRCFHPPPKSSHEYSASFDDERLVRIDVCKLLAQRDSLRRRLALSKISTSPWSRFIKIRRNVDSRIYSLVTPLVVTVVHNEHEKYHDAQGYLGHQEQRCKLFDLQAQSTPFVLWSQMSLSECRKHVEACYFFDLKVT